LLNEAPFGKITAINYVSASLFIMRLKSDFDAAYIRFVYMLNFGAMENIKNINSLSEAFIHSINKAGPNISAARKIHEQ